MKTNLPILLLAVLLILTGCTNHTASTTTQPSSSVSTSLPISYQIYCDSPLNAVKAESDTDTNNIPFQNASQLDLAYSSTNSMINKNADHTKELLLGKDTFHLQLERSYSNSFSKCPIDHLCRYGYFDEYEANTANGRVVAAFRQNTDQLVYFIAFDRLNQDGNLTEQAARECADAFLLETYGKAVLNEYQSVVMTTTSESTYMFAYSKVLIGYTTNDQIIIEVNRKGEIASVNAKRWGIFDPLETEITEQRIADAEAVLCQSISEAYEIQDKQLLVDANSGKCYLQLVVARSTDTGYQGNFFYINVN